MSKDTCNTSFSTYTNWIATKNVNYANGNKTAKSFDAYLKEDAYLQEKEIRAAARKTGKKELLTNY